MMQALEDSKSEKEINKFQKQPFACVLQNRCYLKNFAILTGNTCVLESLPATLVKRDFITGVFL